MAAATSPRLTALRPTAPPDALVLLLAGVLMTIGVVMVYSASVSIDDVGPFTLQGWWKTPLRQCVFAAAGFAAMMLVAGVDYRRLRWEEWTDGWRPGLAWVVAVVLLVAMWHPALGRQTLGATRSIVVIKGMLSFQPAEVAKIALVIWLAALLSSPLFRIDSLRRGFGVATVSAGVLIGLVAIEDFGTAALMGVVLVCLLVLGGARWLHLGLLGLGGVRAGAAFIIHKPYRLTRILTYISDAPDPSGAGYQIDQALKAIATGGWFGRGLGAGVQKYDYLPQGDNDFILAIICEELGIVGGLVVALLFLGLLARGWWLVRHAPDPFGRLLAAGLTLTICLQAAFNVAVVTNSVPTKGISLPFVSAGGSGVVFLGVAAGLLASIGRYCPAPDEPRRLAGGP